MKRALNVFGFITYILYLTACGSSGGGESGVAQSPSPPSITVPTQPGATVSGTYYTLVKNAVVSQGGNSYQITMTGHCVVIESTDYCWDDGRQVIAALNTWRSFWGLCEQTNGTVAQCHGGTWTDPVDQRPTKWSEMSAKLPTPPYQPSDVYTQGIATQVTCTVTGAVLDCVDFQIDSNQAPL